MPEENNKKSDYSSSLAHSIHHFTENLYRATVDVVGESSNMAISPLIVYISLVTTAMGARESTLDQIEETLKLTMKDTEWQENMKRLLDKIMASKEENALGTSKEINKETNSNDSSLYNWGVDEIYQAYSAKKKSVIEIAHTIWTSKDCYIKPEYLDSIGEIFKTEARPTDFKNLDVVHQMINEHVSSVTRGYISEALPKNALSESTVMVLVNALYFKGSWNSPFDPMLTRVERFFIDEERSVEVSMMHAEENFEIGTFDDLDATAILLRYEDCRHGLLCVLPNEKSGLKETENRLFKNDYTPSKLLKKMGWRNVALALPKFKTRFNSAMCDMLQKMGIVDLFQENADLSGISPCPLRLSKAYHLATFEVDEYGTVGAAVSEDFWDEMSAGFPVPEPIVFRADHPFLFYLIDIENDNIPLFVGCLNNPSLSP